VYMGDEDGVDQVKMEDDGVIALGRAGGSSQEGRRRCQAWWRSDTRRHRGFGGFVLKTIGGVWWFHPQNHQHGLVVRASKPSVDRFTGLGLKTRVDVPRRNE
jgi:hypothetical protein